MAGYVIGGSFIPYLCACLGVVLIFRGWKPGWFATHFDEEKIAGNPYRREESLKKWFAAILMCLVSAYGLALTHRRIAPEKPDLTKTILGGMRQLWEVRDATKFPVPIPTVEHIPSPTKVSIPIIGLAPYAILKHVRYKMAGEDVGGTHYGLGAILRVMNTTATAIQIRQLEIVGDVQADGDDYLMAFAKDGDSLEALDVAYGKVKPFRTLSWVVYPIDDSYVREREEKFIRFIIADPEKHRARHYGGEAKDYFG